MLVVVLVTSFAVTATHEETKLTAEGDAKTSALFGTAAAVSGDVVIVGASKEDHSGANQAGAAYVFSDSSGSWTREARLSLGAPDPLDNFGQAVAADGDYVAAGVPNWDRDFNEDGQVQIFEDLGGSWGHDDTVFAGSPEAEAHFGASVALEGQTLVVGAPEEDAGGDTDAGAIYVFVLSGGSWSQQARIDADTDIEAGANFGYDVAMSGETLLVSAAPADGPGTDSGEVYVFHRSGSSWSRQALLVPQDHASGDWFGWSVDLDQDTAVIGAPLKDDGGTDRGAAYVFTRSGGTWSEQTKLVSSDRADDDRFGISVAVDGDLVLAGANNEDDPGVGSGAAYVFTRSGGSWPEHAKIESGDLQDGDGFGDSVALGGSTAAIGASFEDAMATDDGAAYIRTLDLEPTAAFGFTPSNPGPGDSVSFDATTSSDPEGSIASYEWDWTDDGTLDATGSTASHTYSSAGTYTVRLRVTDAAGHAVETTDSVQVQTAGPTASWTHSPTSPNATDNVQFTDQSSGSVQSWSWDFGDGTTSTQQNPTHSFATQGTYNVCLTVTDGTGNKGKSCDNVVVGAAPQSPPTAAFSFTPTSPMAGESIQFTDGSIDDGAVTAWSWELGDGTTATQQNPSHSYADDGRYDVCLEVTDDAGTTDRTCRSIDVANAPPDPGIDTTARTASTGEAVTFTASPTDADGTVRSIEWDFGDGTTATGPSPSHTYDEPGTYQVTVTATDDDDDVQTQSFTVQVEDSGLPLWVWGLVGLVALAAVGGAAYYAGKEGLGGGDHGGPGGEEE